MNFKFPVGQAVEFTPRGGKTGLFKVTRQMPQEHQALDLKYRIQNEQGAEWSAFEFDLTASDQAAGDYEKPRPVRHVGRY